MLDLRQFSLLLLLLVGLLAACGGGETTSSEEADVATDFTLARLGGGDVTLSDHRGQFVLINFWATWCIPCRAEMPYLQEVDDAYGDDFIVLAVNMGEDEDRVRPFIEEMGYTYPILLNPPQEMTREHNVRGLPVSFIVGPDGDIVYRRVGEILPEEFDLWLEENVVQ